MGLRGTGWGLQVLGTGPHHVLVIEQVHHTSCPLAHGHQVRRGLVEPQQAQGRTLLHTVHAVPVGTRCGVEWGVRVPPAPYTSPPLVPPRKGGQREEESHVEPGSHMALLSWAARSRVFHLPGGLYLSPPEVTGRVKCGAWLGTFTQSPSTNSVPTGPQAPWTVVDKLVQTPVLTELTLAGLAASMHTQ